MRKALLTLALCLMATSCYAEDVDMGIIKEIESSNCRFQIGDGGKALGCYQLHKGVIDDYNRAFGTKYLHKIALNEAKAKEIGNWYMNHKIPKMLRYKGTKDTVEARLTAYNMGIGNAWKGKRAEAYIAKYRRIQHAREDVKGIVASVALAQSSGR